MEIFFSIQRLGKAQVNQLVRNIFAVYHKIRFDERNSAWAVGKCPLSAWNHFNFRVLCLAQPITQRLLCFSRPQFVVVCRLDFSQLKVEKHLLEFDHHAFTLHFASKKFLNACKLVLNGCKLFSWVKW